MLLNIKNKSIKVKFIDENFKLPEEIQNKIDEFWKKVQNGNNNIWNGKITCVSECKVEENSIMVTCKKSNYAHYLYDERIGLSKEYACFNLAAGCLLETSDNYYIVGELAQNTSYPYCMQISGGNADSKDIKKDEIDILCTIERETKEELNIDLKDKKIIDGYEIRYISLPDEKVHSYILFAKGQLKITKQEMEKHYQDYLENLTNNNGEIEFGKIHFIKRGNIAEQLQKLKNPKREYLLKLLELDSKIPLEQKI